MTRSLRLCAFVGLALSVAWLVGAARTLGSATAPSTTDLSARIRRVETGLLPAVKLSGEPRVAWALADRMQHYGTPGVSIAVIDGGKLTWARGYGVLQAGGTAPVTADTLFEAASLSKPITAVAAMRLVANGRLALDEDVNRWLRNWKVPSSELTRERKVTLRRLLSHTAGVSGHGFRGYAPGERVPTLLAILQGRAPANTERRWLGGWHLGSSTSAAPRQGEQRLPRSTATAPAVDSTPGSGAVRELSPERSNPCCQLAGE